MELISVKDKLPESNKDVLVYGRFGHDLNFYVGRLNDSNGKDGFQEFWHPILGTSKRHNESFPENLSWSISGHPVPFERVTHWAELPARPIK